jgi:hypothetical protein
MTSPSTAPLRKYATRLVECTVTRKATMVAPNGSPRETTERSFAVKPVPGHLRARSMVRRPPANGLERRVSGHRRSRAGPATPRSRGRAGGAGRRPAYRR